jgi:hypothetical protein
MFLYPMQLRIRYRQTTFICLLTTMPSSSTTLSVRLKDWFGRERYADHVHIAISAHCQASRNTPPSHSSQSIPGNAHPSGYSLPSVPHNPVQLTSAHPTHPLSSNDTIESVYNGAKLALGVVKNFAEPLPPLKTAVEDILKIIEIVEVQGAHGF